MDQCRQKKLGRVSGGKRILETHNGRPRLWCWEVQLMILKDIHSECQRCTNLKAWSIHMNGDHDYCCRCRPSGFISKDLHQEPCERFEEKAV